MLTTLLESHHQRTRNIHFQLVSVSVHIGLILLAVVATRGAVAAVVAPEPPPNVVWLPPVKPIIDVFPGPPLVMPQLPTTPAFPVVTQIPSELPPIDLSGTLSTITDVIRTSVPVGPATVGDSRMGSSALTASEVDAPARLLAGSGRPNYPESLRSAGLSGEVTAQFVIDVTGRVDMGTLEILSSTHDRFVDAVKRALEKARFAPAEFGGQKVRQVVRMPFVFSLKSS